MWQASVTGLVTGVGDAVETQKEEDDDDDYDDHDDLVMFDVADGNALFTDKDKDGDECERPAKTHKRRKKSNHARKPHDSTGNQKVGSI